MLRRDYTIVQDTRERKPLLFGTQPGAPPKHLPILRDFDGSTTTVRLHVVRDALPTGDYALRGYERLMLVERKGSVGELAKNCLTGDRDRVRRAFGRLRDECRMPVLLLEGTMTSMKKSRYVKKPYAAFDALCRLVAEYDLRLIMLSNSTVHMRQLIGEYVARLLINTAVAYDGTENKAIQPGEVMSQVQGFTTLPAPGSNEWIVLRDGE